MKKATMEPTLTSLNIDPNYRATKTLTELSAEHPEQAGLKQLSSAEQMENPPPQLAALRYAYLQIISGRKRSE
ncbi:MAG: hypothetical protein AMXMBFR31_29520 [Candidatus Desulfobacillus denitrificans]